MAYGASGGLAFGSQHGGLYGLGQLRATGVDTGLAGQTLDAVASPRVVPRLQRALADVTPARAGDRILLTGELTQQLQQPAAFEPLAAHDGAEHGQPEQGHGIDVAHEVSVEVERDVMKRRMPGRRQWADSVGCPLPHQTGRRAWR
ncbi:hypothetical protein WI87_30705 [Burkholderia ubonensis]|nr:hypothetical protein WI87_14035 [Burkholderia ubonensis]KVD66286.1 hypothetical protein WI87_30705 [Burkholderia ubonensis]